MIAPYVRSLTAVDTAQGMIDAFKLKLERQIGVQNVLPVCVLLEDPDGQRIRPDPLSKDGTHKKESELGLRRFDLIISHLVLHHIPSLESIFSTMHGCLKSEGSVALMNFEDFGPEARKFHPEAKMDGVERHGIQREAAARLLREAGFTNIKIVKAFEMEKGVEAKSGEGVVKGENGSKMTFPFLICIARKA
jgi:SAM-dependent methyltransferase